MKITIFHAWRDEKGGGWLRPINNKLKINYVGIWFVVFAWVVYIHWFDEFK